MERKKCPYCGEEIAATAKKCRFCGEWLGETPAPQNVTRQRPSQPEIPVQPAQRAFIQPQVQNYTGTGEEREVSSFLEAYFVNPYFRHYADFGGRTSRKVFWMSYLVMFIISLGIGGIILGLSSLIPFTGMIIGCAIGGLFSLALFIPQLAISCRRLRDAGKSPYMIFLGLIPLVGGIILLIFLCQPSVDADEDPEVEMRPADWGVLGGCCALFVAGIILSIVGIGNAINYDLGDFDSQVEEIVEDEYPVDEVVAEESVGYEYGGGVVDLSQIADNIDPNYFTYELQTYRMGSDRKMEQMFNETGSTNVPIEATGVISDHSLTLQGWITEDGTIHGRYHNENGINLDFNGYITRDNGLYIQLGHDSEKSDWILHPVASELPQGYCRYEGKWGKSQKDSYLIFSVAE